MNIRPSIRQYRLRSDRVAGFGFFDLHRQRISAGDQSGGELVCTKVLNRRTGPVSLHATCDPSHRLLAPQCSRFTRYYVHIRNEY
ncbi:hypothetical protein BZM26_00705 [Paraburkholderia strydomiana]|nr:hypothetical protein BZM26_00705 [Paraburkholderia strydomiana]